MQDKYVHVSKAKRCYSSTLRRTRFFSLSRRFESSRRATDEALGFVARRAFGLCARRRSSVRTRDSAVSRLRVCERLSVAIRVIPVGR